MRGSRRVSGKGLNVEKSVHDLGDTCPQELPRQKLSTSTLGCFAKRPERKRIMLAVMARFLLPDDLWNLIQPLLP